MAKQCKTVNCRECSQPFQTTRQKSFCSLRCKNSYWKEIVKLGAPSEQRDHVAILMAIVQEHGPIERQRLIDLAMIQSGRAEQSCYGALRNLVATGLLEREEHSRKRAIIREPAAQTLLALLGGARMPACIPEGRVIRWEQEELVA